MSAVIVGYARTPFVKYNGVFQSVPATELGAHAIRAALSSAGVDPASVEMVFGGQVLQGAAGQNPARQSAVGAGIPFSTPAITLNAVCLSGMEAIVNAARMIDAGEAHIVVAVGQESMSLAPHAWSGSRAGARYGAIELVDTLAHDGLTDAFEHRSMGLSTDERNEGLAVTREAQDAWSARSHQTLARASEVLAGEIAPFTVAGRKGDIVISTDDGGRPGTTVETLAGLRAAFGAGSGSRSGSGTGSGADTGTSSGTGTGTGSGTGAGAGGTITAGNSSQITDGAAALVLMSDTAAAALGAHALATVVAHAFVAGPDVSLHAQPANAILAALAKTAHRTSDLVAVEINEAFAAVAVHSTRVLDIDETIVNTNGGAIALGHPIGASGARIVGHLARRLAALGPGSVGAAGICGGGGQGSAVVLVAV